MGDAQDQPMDVTRTKTDETSTDGSSGDRQRYLLVVIRSSSFVWPLGPSGEAVIGRDDEAPLRIDDRTASHRHAKLLFDEETVSIIDLESRNGTRVNGERLAPGTARLLAAGDVITLADATLVYHVDALPDAPRVIREMIDLRRRIAEELERSGTYTLTFGMVCLKLDGDIDWPRLEVALGRTLRLMDAAARDGSSRAFLLLPELSPEELVEWGHRLREALAPLSRALSIGLAAFPRDGTTIESLLHGARAAADRSTTVNQADEAVERITVGGRTVLVADAAMVRLYELIGRLGPGELPVLIHGETGTGKEICAQVLHERSARCRGPFVAVNCAALTPSLVESELFGHTRGAFTGATSDRPGLIESADGGTLFLDELGDLPLEVQAKLLRVLEERSFRRVGEVRERTVDVRLVAATWRDLGAEVKAGRFRQDLYFRLAGATLELPPLRHRPRELHLLAHHFLATYTESRGRRLRLPLTALEWVLSYHWPGNARQLRNAMEYLADTVTGDEVRPEHLQEWLRRSPVAEEVVTAPVTALPPPEPPSFRPIYEEIRALEQQRMKAAIDAAQGQLNRAAELIKMPLRTFMTKAKQYGFSAQRTPAEASPRATKEDP